MTSPPRRSGRTLLKTAVIALAALAPAAPAALAQGLRPPPPSGGASAGPSSLSYVNPAYRVGPNFTPINQAAYNTRTMGNAMQHVPYRPGAYGPNVNVNAMPGYGYPGYDGAYGMGAWGNSANGYLTGAASVINAQGQFAVQ